jgi:hypothetical protein
MALKRDVVLSRALIDRCIRHGQEMVDSYARGENPASHAVSSHGMDSNPKGQAQAKMGECAFAIAAGLDPEEDLNWTMRPDHWDAVYFRCRVDVKTISMGKELLIWPVNKTGFYLSKRFHALVHVKAEPPAFVIDGWIDKAGFYCMKSVSNGERGITPGTWYMHEDQLWDISQLDELLLRDQT